jgi:hypothetical protein
MSQGHERSLIRRQGEREAQPEGAVVERYRDLNEVHKRAEDEKQRQAEQAKTAEAERTAKDAEKRQDSQPRGYEALREAAAELVREQNEARQREETLRLAQEAREGMNRIFGEEARDIARDHDADASRSPMKLQGQEQEASETRAQHQQGGYLEMTPNGTRRHPPRVNAAARQEEQASQREEPEQPRSLAKGNELTERALAREAQDSGKEKTAAQLEREAKISEFMQQMRQGRELEQGRERGRDAE